MAELAAQKKGRPSSASRSTSWPARLLTRTIFVVPWKSCSRRVDVNTMNMSGRLRRKRTAEGRTRVGKRCHPPGGRSHLT